MISTEKGQSGAPIIAIDKFGQLRIIGIHKGGLKLNNYYKSQDGQKKLMRANVGKLLDHTTLHRLKKWMQNNKCQQFRSTNKKYQPPDEQTPSNAANIK